MSEKEPEPKGIAEGLLARLGVAGDSDGMTARSIMARVGGWVGILESALPALSFVLVLAIFNSTVAAVITAVLIAVGFIGRQIVRGKPLGQAIAGLVGVAITAFLPLREGGKPADYFVPGFFTNGIYAGVITAVLSIGWLVFFIRWISRPADRTQLRLKAPRYQRFTIAALLFVALFVARLAVQLPLYFSGQIEALGIARVVMGVPPYALCIWLAWLLLRVAPSASR
jgi:hypothetical protein